ncbi:hypothetical protein [Comamonas suwonensis]|jgi:hypothetical protein|uniref:Uncharacterized protein n=1 Tax=Comamonas suwonensis TaxID=2606214 RepID=A0A843B8G6_9BURK|nr:hypothetical protein [Comamonas suwonensis]MBI1625915.1 hypothetical protein [Comamonas suwonensis]
MTPSEIFFKLKSLPASTPITAEHIIAILGSLQAPQTVSATAGAYSTWDNDKLIDTDTLSEWIGEIPSRLKKWRVDGVGPKFISKAKHVAYRVGDVRDWIASRTVQSTTQADSLSFVSAFDGCFVEPTIYHDDQQPYSLFDSIEIFSGNQETGITGFEVFTTIDPTVIAYLKGDYATLDKVADLNAAASWFTNGTAQHGTLAHVIARHTAVDLPEWLPTLLDRGLNFSATDSNGRTALDGADDHLKNYLTKRDMMLRFAEKFPPKASTS